MDRLDSRAMQTSKLAVVAVALAVVPALAFLGCNKKEDLAPAPSANQAAAPPPPPSPPPPTAAPAPSPQHAPGKVAARDAGTRDGAVVAVGLPDAAVVEPILPHLSDSREFSDMLITEAKLAARLDHANIVQVHDLGKADGFLYIAMQYVEGFDLNDLLRRCTRTKTALPVQYALLV